MPIKQLRNDAITQRCAKCGEDRDIMYSEIELGVEIDSEAGYKDTNVIALPACVKCGSKEFLLRNWGKSNLKGQGVESPEVVEGAETRSELVGLWETAKQSTRGLGSFMEFRSNGTFVSGMGAMMDFNYQIKGKEFVIISGARNAEKQTRIDIDISGDIMTNKGPDGKELRKKRVTQKDPGGSDIVGVWKYEHYTGGPAYERYTVDGRMLLRVPFPGASIGEYEVSGNTLKMSYKGQGTEIIDFKIEGNALSLSKGKGSHSRFVKSQHGVWYKPVTTSD